MNSATPLIVLDGVEISKADLNALDPEVIESFSVLKDATASAMYGTRGANGVLIIKTKSGSDLEKPIIGVRVEAYVNTPIKRPKTVAALRAVVARDGRATNMRRELRENFMLLGLLVCAIAASFCWIIRLLEQQ